MSIFDGLTDNLFRRVQPEELTDTQAQQRVEDTGRSVTERVDAFARNYLAPDTYQRYRDGLRSLRYDIEKLPSKVVTLYNMLTGEVKRYFEGILGLYDEERNRIGVNEYVAKDPESEQLEPVMGHEEVHRATRNWLRDYFDRFGEKARGVVEGFTSWISQELGYNSNEYPGLKYAAYQTLRRLGDNVYDALYNVINFNIYPERVLDTFYDSLRVLEQERLFYTPAN